MSKILELNLLLKNNEFNKRKLIENTVNTLVKNKHLNAYISLVNNFDEVDSKSTSLLNGIPYAVKDNINVHKTLTTGGSKFFSNYISCYNATVIDLLNKSGAMPIAKANLDEFGLGGTGTFSAYGHVYNPYFQNRITSGSSSGSAVLVANDTVSFALGTDTGDSIRKPASYLGIIGYKPTYGLISRYGVFPYAPSLDHVGLLAKSVTDIAIVADEICKHDEKDFTSQLQADHNFFKRINDLKKEYKLVYFENILEFMPMKSREIFLDAISRLKKENIQIYPIQFPVDIISAIAPTYKIISYSEAVSCYQNITGIPFGNKEYGKNFEDKISITRSKHFGHELKRRMVFGSYCTLKENYEDVFLHSKKIRRIIVEKTNEIFKHYDFVIMPGSSTIAPTIEELNSTYKDTYVDDYLQIANFGGFPSITLPMGKIDNNPIGINLMGDINFDSDLLTFAKYMNETLNEGD